MNRLITYREFEIHVELTEAAPDMYNVTFQVKGHNIGRLTTEGAIVHVRHGPFTRRWAYLVAEIAGQAAIDVLIGLES